MDETPYDFAADSHYYDDETAGMDPYDDFYDEDYRDYIGEDGSGSYSGYFG